MTTNERNQEWYRKDSEAWDAAAADLINHGYKRHDDEHGHTTFTHDVGLPTVTLVRSLGKLDWHAKRVD